MNKSVVFCRFCSHLLKRCSMKNVIFLCSRSNRSQVFFKMRTNLQENFNLCVVKVIPQKSELQTKKCKKSLRCQYFQSQMNQFLECSGFWLFQGVCRPLTQQMLACSKNKLRLAKRIGTHSIKKKKNENSKNERRGETNRKKRKKSTKLTW